ncbi:MAG TPA: NAD(P)-dependent oxidoreductase [Ignavibacteriaceae bacterium]|nr:NAD(P)-dependent oxidoreductase [Ignavibacteriaceae bacterium]
MNNSKIAVVTGANGFVGSHLVDLLLEKNYQVRCIIRKTSNLQWLKGKNVEIFNCGLLDRDGVRKAFQNVNYIFHVAGVVKAKSPEGYFKGNVENTRALLEVAVEFNTLKRFVILSSQTVSGPSEDERPVNEDDSPNPITTYGRSKLAQENVAKEFMDRIPITIVRAPAVYGERDTEIFIFFRTFSKGLFTTIGLDKKLISLIHVVDLVRGTLMAAENPSAAGKTYFISSEKFHTWEEIGDVSKKIMKKKPIHVKVPHFIVFFIAAIAQFLALFSKKPATLNIEKAKDITRHAWICSTEKAVKELGYHQEIPVEEGIRRTVNWYKEQHWL